VGAPTLIIATAENQTVVVDELARRGAAATTMPRAFPDDAAIGAALTRLLADADLRAELAQRSRGLVDGLGALRVALSLSAATLIVRRARPEDSPQVFAWRNDPATRAVSLDSREIARETHDAWYARALADPTRTLLIGMVGARAVGVIRFDRREGGEQEISLFLDPAQHGLGLGAHLLSAGEAHIGPARFLARVVEGNEKSRDLFATAGYHNESPGVWRKE
jgi:UDP-2,4-diacetamido-2,4,6-trideoxy-beta-L-altropyranose hydrolase